MTQPKKEKPPLVPGALPGPMDTGQPAEARAIYGAMIAASADGCQCHACQILRRLYQKVSAQIAQAALKELDEIE